MPTTLTNDFWDGCDLISRDSQVVHGEPVFKGTRMAVETAVENYHAFRDVEDLSDEEAIEETLKSFPTIPVSRRYERSLRSMLPANIR